MRKTFTTRPGAMDIIINLSTPISPHTDDPSFPVERHQNPNLQVEPTTAQHQKGMRPSPPEDHQEKQPKKYTRLTTEPRKPPIPVQAPRPRWWWWWCVVVQFVLVACASVQSTDARHLRSRTPGRLRHPPRPDLAGVTRKQITKELSIS